MIEINQFVHESLLLYSIILSWEDDNISVIQSDCHLIFIERQKCFSYAMPIYPNAIHSLFLFFWLHCLRTSPTSDFNFIIGWSHFRETTHGTNDSCRHGTSTSLYIYPVPHSTDKLWSKRVLFSNKSFSVDQFSYRNSTQVRHRSNQVP